MFELKKKKVMEELISEKKKWANHTHLRPGHMGGPLPQLWKAAPLLPLLKLPLGGWAQSREDKPGEDPAYGPRPG